MRWSCSPGFRDRANLRLPSARCMRKRSGAISNRCRPMRGGCFTKWKYRRSIRSKACRRRLRFNSSAGRPPRVHPSAASRRFRIYCACCIRAPATTRAGRRCFTRNRSRLIRRRAHVPPVTASGGSTMQPSNRWCRTLPYRSASVRSRRGRRPGMVKTCAISASRLDSISTNRGATYRRRIGIGCCLPMSSPPFRCMPDTSLTKFAKR